MSREYGLNVLEIIQSRVSIGQAFLEGGQLGQADTSKRVIELLVEVLNDLNVSTTKIDGENSVKKFLSLPFDDAQKFQKLADKKNSVEKRPEDSFQLQYLSALSICLAFKNNEDMADIFEGGASALKVIQDRHYAN